MQIAYPFAKPYPITDDYAAHVARNSTAPGIDFAAPMQDAHSRALLRHRPRLQDLHPGRPRLLDSQHRTPQRAGILRPPVLSLPAGR